MGVVWVRAGQCGNETAVDVRRIDMTHVAVDFTTTCARVQALADELKTLDIAREMSVSLLDTTVYQSANQHMCRHSCIVPAAILKALEAEAGIFPPADSEIRFMDPAG